MLNYIKKQLKKMHNVLCGNFSNLNFLSLNKAVKMNKYGIIIISLLVLSCGASNPTVVGNKRLYEVLTQKSDGGGNIRFFEILSEPREIKMLQNDVNLSKKISPEDVQNSNFVILNMGEKASSGYSIGVHAVEETEKNIIITIKETTPEPGSMVSQVITYPFCVVKINSKKEIIIK